MINLSLYIDNRGDFNAPRYAIDYFTGKETGSYSCSLGQLEQKDRNDFYDKVTPLFTNPTILFLWDRLFKHDRRYGRAEESSSSKEFLNENTIKKRTRVVSLLDDPCEMVLSTSSEELELFYPLEKQAEAKTLTDQIEEIFKPFKSASEIIEQEPCIELVVSRDGEIYTNSYRIKPVEFSVEENYESTFIPVDEKIKEFCAEENANGIVLLHGVMGSGKTYYIRHLINHLHELDKQIIYFPPNMIEYIAEPSFVTFMQDNSGKILILEDAEKILKKREMSQNTNAASNILNISDGLLGDALKLKIIATFNCERKLIDPALLRKGRLITEYKFDKLSPEKSKEIAQRLGIRRYRKGSYTLAELFNWGK